MQRVNQTEISTIKYSRTDSVAANAILLLKHAKKMCISAGDFDWWRPGDVEKIGYIRAVF